MGRIGSGKGREIYSLGFISLYTYSWPPTEPRVLRKVCVVVGGGWWWLWWVVCKTFLVLSLSLSQAEQLLSVMLTNVDFASSLSLNMYIV